MLDIIQGERQTWKITVFKVDAAGVKSFQDLTGNTEIKVCFKSGVNLLELTRVGAPSGRVIVDNALEGKISGEIKIAETDAMPETADGSVEVQIHFSATDIRKSIILDSHKVTAKIC